MTTKWTLPTIFSQYAEPEAELVHIAWDDSKGYDALRNVDTESLVTNGTLAHISRYPKYDVLSKTYYLKVQGFSFEDLPESLSGIELRLSTNRRGRVTDETIQLCLDNTLIGENQAGMSLEPVNVYGGNTTLWNTKNLSMSDIQDPKFGVVLRFQSHLHYPHRDGAYINAVELRIH